MAVQVLKARAQTKTTPFKAGELVLNLGNPIEGPGTYSLDKFNGESKISVSSQNIILSANVTERYVSTDMGHTFELAHRNSIEQILDDFNVGGVNVNGDGYGRDGIVWTGFGLRDNLNDIEADEGDMFIGTATGNDDVSLLFHFHPSEEGYTPGSPSDYIGLDRIRIFPFEGAKAIILSQWSERVGFAEEAQNPVIFVHDQDKNLLNTFELPNIAEGDLNEIHRGVWHSPDNMLHDDQKGYAVIDQTLEDGGELVYKVEPYNVDAETGGLTQVAQLPTETGRGVLGDLFIDPKRKVFIFGAHPQGSSAKKGFISFGDGFSFNETEFNADIQGGMFTSSLQWKKKTSALMHAPEDIKDSKGLTFDASAPPDNHLSGLFLEAGGFDNRTVLRAVTHLSNRRVSKLTWMLGRFGD